MCCDFFLLASFLLIVRNVFVVKFFILCMGVKGLNILILDCTGFGAI